MVADESGWEWFAVGEVEGEAVRAHRLFFSIRHRPRDPPVAFRTHRACPDPAAGFSPAYFCPE